MGSGQLDCEHWRVKDLNWIESPQLDDAGKAHWVACYYADEVEITSPSGGGVRVRLKWRAPLKASDDELLLIRTLLQELRETKFNQEARSVQVYLKGDEKSEPYFVEYVLPEDPLKFHTVKPLPQRVRDYIINKYLPYRFKKKEAPKAEAIRELSGNGALDEL